MIEKYDGSGVQILQGEGSLGSSTKSKRSIVHGKDDDTRVLGDIFGDSTNVGFNDVISVDEGLFTGRLNPDFMFSEFSEDIEGCDVKSESSALGEFTDADTETRRN